MGPHTATQRRQHGSGSRNRRDHQGARSCIPNRQQAWPGQGQIGVRVGRLLVYVANREALGSFLQAWGQAAGLAEQAFGPDLPLPRVGESISAE